jgi:tRNA A37 threonylcarbamoyladenosine biosynthesis protein TsaE
MEKYINYSSRSETELLKKYLKEITDNKSDNNNCKGILIRGDYGSGKTTFVKTVLQELNYDVIEYDHTLSGQYNLDVLFNKQSRDISIMNIFNKTKQQKVILVDDLECINKNEKGIIIEITKQLRGKKTKSQKNEGYSLNPVVCICSNNNEKKINDLGSKIYNINFNVLSDDTIKTIISENNINYSEDVLNKNVKYISGNLYKLNNLLTINKNIIYDTYENTYIYNTRNTVKHILLNKIDINYKNSIDETDRTSIALLYHENIIDYYKNLNEALYINCLDHFCFADYIDRITFQKQIWIFNEMTCLIKLISVNNILFTNNIKYRKIDEVRFTKILTKYSTEYNNKMFLIKLSHKLNIDIDELMLYFIESNYIDDDNITQLEKNRMCKFIAIE